jgi:hypothetical protein
LNEHNIYQNVKLIPGQIYEVIIKNDDQKAVLTWDYESNKEIMFTAYEIINDDISEVSNGKCLALCHACIIKKFLSAHLEDEFTSIIDVAGLKENVNYKKKEQTISSCAKESIQGSFELEKATYILQWMNPPTSENSCRLMYFYEVLSSANYRGSMTSLQSQSAISLHSIIR